MRSRKKSVLLVRIAIDRESDEIRTRAAEIQQRVALRWRAIAAYQLAVLRGGDEKLQKIIFDPAASAGKILKRLRPVKAELLFLLDERIDRRRGRIAGVVATHVQAQ